MMTLTQDRSETRSWDVRLEGQFRAMLADERIEPFFQPVVDLYTGGIFGHEVLSRGVEPFRMPRDMFGFGELLGLSWDLEYTCRTAALRTIATFDTELKNGCYFINVSPRIFDDARFRSGFTLSYIRELGLDRVRIVLEITELTSIEDYGRFEHLIRHYADQGFNLALDDFGAGHSGLTTLAAMSPHYIKIDRGLISGIHKSAYKQQLIKSVVAFAGAVESNIIAEGVEDEEELDAVFRLGIRYAQGYLLGRPAGRPEQLVPEVRSLIQEKVRRFHYTRCHMDISIADIIQPVESFGVKTTKCAALDEHFRKHAQEDHIVLTAGRHPVSLLTRQHFYNALSGRYGYSVFQNKFIDEIGSAKTLILPESFDIRTLSREAMNRSGEDLYDPVIIVDDKGVLVGTVSMRQVLRKSIDLEVRIASGSNPLTQLPGNLLVNLWLQEAVQSPVYAIIYADLDNFKEYNDVFGFTGGDDMIRTCARVLTEHACGLSGTAQVGHIGGDDFVLVAKEEIHRDVLEDICRDFDERKMSLFPEETRKQGWFSARRRTGELANIPLVTISLAVLTQENLTACPQLPRIGAAAAMLKRKAKSVTAATGRSGFFIDRRTCLEDSAAASATQPRSGCDSPGFFLKGRDTGT